MARTSSGFVESRSCARLPVFGVLYEYSGVLVLGGLVVQALNQGSVTSRLYRKSVESLIFPQSRQSCEENGRSSRSILNVAALNCYGGFGPTPKHHVFAVFFRHS